MMCWPSVVEEGDVHLNGKYIALVSCGKLGTENGLSTVETEGEEP